MTTGARTLDTRRAGWRPYEVVGRGLAAVTPGRGTGHARILSFFIIASVPAALVGAWNAGLEWLSANPAAVESPSTWPQHAVFPTFDDVAASLGRAVQPFVLLPAPGEENGYLRRWAPVEIGPGRHYAYAFQWFAMAVVLAGLLAWNYRKRGYGK